MFDLLEPNPDWLYDLEGFEPWEPDEEEGDILYGCHYCGGEDTRYDPFAGEPCCNACFNDIIGGDTEDEPFVCGTELDDLDYEPEDE